MIYKAGKIALALGVVVIGASLLLSTSSAQVLLPRDTALDPSVKVEAKAKFQAAAFIMIEHEPFSFDGAFPAPDVMKAVTRQASISVKGLQGETVVMTCNVESRKGENFVDDRNVHTRDCNGAAQTHLQVIMSGQRYDNGVLLTKDLLPDPAGDVASNISIEVTYI